MKKIEEVRDQININLAFGKELRIAPVDTAFPLEAANLPPNSPAAFIARVRHRAPTHSIAQEIGEFS
jgi:hypothetical protein